MFVTNSDGRAWLAVALTILPTAGALAHGFAGSRFFPATITIDDPFVADELGNYGLDCARPIAYLISQGDRPCSFRSNFPIPATTMKTPPASSLNRFAGRMVRIARSAARSIR